MSAETVAEVGVADFLRYLADEIDSDGYLPMPSSITKYSISWFVIADGEAATKEEMRSIRRRLPAAIWEKVYFDKYFSLKTNLFGMEIEITSYRNQVCRRVVTGFETAMVPDPEFVVPLVEVQKEIVEWVCDE